MLSLGEAARHAGETRGRCDEGNKKKGNREQRVVRLGTSLAHAHQRPREPPVEQGREMAGNGFAAELGRGSCVAHATDKRALLSGVLLPSAGEAGRRRIRLSRRNLPTPPARAWPCASRPEMETRLLAGREGTAVGEHGRRAAAGGARLGGKVELERGESPASGEAKPLAGVERGSAGEGSAG